MIRCRLDSQEIRQINQPLAPSKQGGRQELGRFHYCANGQLQKWLTEQERRRFLPGNY